MTVQVKRNVWLELEPKVSGSYVNLLPVTGVIGYAQPVMTQEYVSNLLEPKVRTCITSVALDGYSLRFYSGLLFFNKEGARAVREINKIMKLICLQRTTCLFKLFFSMRGNNISIICPFSLSSG